MGLFDHFKKKEQQDAHQMDEPPSLEEPSVVGGSFPSEYKEVRYEEPSFPKDSSTAAPPLPKELRENQDAPEFPLPPNLDGFESYDEPKQPWMSEPMRPPMHEEHHFIEPAQEKYQSALPFERVQPMQPQFSFQNPPMQERPNPFFEMQKEEEHEKSFDSFAKPITQSAIPQDQKPQSRPNPLISQAAQEQPKPVVVQKAGVKEHVRTIQGERYITMQDFSEVINTSHELSRESRLSDDTQFRLVSLAEEEDKVLRRWHDLLEKCREQMESADRLLYG